MRQQKTCRENPRFSRRKMRKNDHKDRDEWLVPMYFAGVSGGTGVVPPAEIPSKYSDYIFLIRDLHFPPTN